MVKRWVQRTETDSEGSVEYEYRDAEYEYEEMPCNIPPHNRDLAVGAEKL